MPFEYGRVSCRIFTLPRPFPEDAIERFAREAAPPINDSREPQYRGWVTGRHLLDRHITEDTARYAGYLRLALLDAQRKIPAALLRAECRMQELAQMEAEGLTRLSRKQRTAIKEEVVERLLPQMPPQLKGIPFIYDEQAQVIYAGALSTAQADLFTAYFTHTLGFSLTPSLPDTIAMLRSKVATADWWPSSYSPHVPDDQVELQPGRDFLTWLWFSGEARGGEMDLPDIGTVGLLLQGPLTFVHEGDGAHEITLRKGDPLLGTESTACLLAGKKLKRARLVIVRDEQVWETNLDADEFTFRGLKLPETRPLDPVSRFQERVRLLDTFREAFFALYDRFVAERNDTRRWKETLAEIHAWARDRDRKRPAD